ncbi:MAG TPA: ribosome maturation factor RimM [Candidatus Dormibacteraeota bacterium]|nr:ribosome maturation factor RimM [Candidatus Dormibacteraeota bacterium]
MPTEAGGEPPILVGMIARAHGLGGEVVVDAYSDAPERFQPGSVLMAAFPTGKTASLVVATMRPFQERLLVRFEGVETRTEAESLHGADLLIARSEVKPLPEGQHYRFELVGLAVKSRDGELLGEVTDVFSTGSNDVYVVRGPRGEILLPAIAGVIVGIDLAQKTMTVAPPAGLPGWDEG